MTRLKLQRLLLHVAIVCSIDALDLSYDKIEFCLLCFNIVFYALIKGKLFEKHFLEEIANDDKSDKRATFL